MRTILDFSKDFQKWFSKFSLPKADHIFERIQRQGFQIKVFPLRCNFDIGTHTKSRAEQLFMLMPIAAGNF